MLILNKPTVEIKDSWCIIKARLNDDKGFSKELFYAVDAKLNDKINDDIDPFVFWAMLIAIQKKESLYVNADFPNRLFYGISQILFPSFKKMGVYVPSLQAKAIVESGENRKVKGVATGLSGGIDSFYTVLEHMQGELKLTHLVNFIPNEKALTFTNEQIKFKTGKSLDVWNDKLGGLLNLPIIKVYSNFNEDCKFHFEKIHAFCNLSHALLLKGIISSYLYSTGYDIEKVALDFSDTSHYELLICQAVNSPYFEMVSYHPAVNRLEKTMAIVDNELVQSFLHVCVKREIGEGNCTECFKCQRVLTTLDALGKLQLFEKVFDLQKYYQNKRKIWSSITYKAKINKDPFALEILSCAKSNGYRKPFGIFVNVLLIGIKNQVRKLKKKKRNN